MEEYDGMPTAYVGDCVYALFDGYGIWLHANSHCNPTNRIYLEPQVIEELQRFCKAVGAPWPSAHEEEEADHGQDSD